MIHAVGKVTYKKASYGSNVTLTVYQVKKNTLQYVGKSSFNTGNTKGNESEVFSVLVAHGLVSVHFYEEHRGYYKWQMSEDKKLKIQII